MAMAGLFSFHVSASAISDAGADRTATEAATG